MGHDLAGWGSVTFVQRFGSSLNLNRHVLVLMLEGSTSMGMKLRFLYQPRRCRTKPCGRSWRRVRAAVLSFAIGVGWLTGHIWLSAMVSWGLKLAILHYWGASMFQRLKPFFLG